MRNFVERNFLGEQNFFWCLKFSTVLKKSEPDQTPKTRNLPSKVGLDSKFENTF
jgi:hypothetical protein